MLSLQQPQLQPKGMMKPLITPGTRRLAVRVRAEQAAPSLGARVKAALSFDAAARERRQQQRQERQRQQQQVAPAEPQRYSLQRALARPEAAASSACAFAVVAAAVFLQPHAALPLDAAAHSWVAAHTSPEWRYAVGELLISDAPIAFGFTLWVALTGATAHTHEPAVASAPSGQSVLLSADAMPEPDFTSSSQRLLAPACLGANWVPSIASGPT
jgi:hypothetical protein